MPRKPAKTLSQKIPGQKVRPAKKKKKKASPVKNIRGMTIYG
jgi:hypothetical protein